MDHTKLNVSIQLIKYSTTVQPLVTGNSDLRTGTKNTHAQTLTYMHSHRNTLRQPHKKHTKQTAHNTHSSKMPNSPTNIHRHTRNPTNASTHKTTHRAHWHKDGVPHKKTQTKNTQKTRQAQHEKNQNFRPSSP